MHNLYHAMGLINLIVGKIPNSWYELFQEENVDKRVESILSIWKEQVGVELRNTISYLSKHLEEVELMNTNGRYSILYTIKTDNGGNSIL